MTQRTGRPRGVTPDGPKIKRLRVELGLTATEVAFRIRCDPQTVRRAERSQPTGAVFTGRIAQVLGVRLSDISDWAGDDEDVSEPETPDRISA